MDIGAEDRADDVKERKEGEETNHDLSFHTPM
jgi:hypothetical protein